MKDILKRSPIVIICLIFIFTIVMQGTVSAATRTHRRTSGTIISEEEAIECACNDIGVELEDAEILTTEIVYEYGLYAYKICMAAQGVKYFYNVGVFDGSIIKVSSYKITYKNKNVG